MPFGEELFANQGGRTAVQGYSVADGIRQKFTSKERDNETGLDYFLARYYSSTQGRFTSPDEPLMDQSPHDPQSWNLYAYVRNNPLGSTDPDGRATVDPEWLQRMTNRLAGYGWRTDEEVKRETVSRLCQILHFTDQTNTPGQLEFTNPTTGERTLYNVQDLTQKEIWDVYDRIRNGAFRIVVSVEAPDIGVGSQISFRGLNRNRPLRDLTPNEIRNAFKQSGYKLSNHAIMRLRDPRTAALGTKTLGDIERLLNEGVVEDAGKEIVTISYGKLKAVVNSATKVIITFAPR